MKRARKKSTKAKGVSFFSTTAAFPGDDTAFGQWPRPRAGSEWDAATRDGPIFFVMHPPQDDVVGLLRESTLRDPFGESQEMLALARGGQEGEKVQSAALRQRRERRTLRFLWAAKAFRSSGGYELALASPQHWLWESVDAAKCEAVFWVRKKDPLQGEQEASTFPGFGTVFPFAPGDTIPLIEAGSLHWCALARIDRVGVRPQQGGSGAAATGYVTATVFL